MNGRGEIPFYITEAERKKLAAEASRHGKRYISLAGVFLVPAVIETGIVVCQGPEATWENVLGAFGLTLISGILGLKSLSYIKKSENFSKTPNDYEI
ncbi:MAG: hypothetical protein UX87_C0014G0008 [Candidatus Amesbacteria bacterium GW2011_GWA1_47_16]|uniref:Holin n=3 Tax=Candidatus Amesiibacteriota TaxID=1752730 RepID=A0A0G1UD07_9BACT|nr:MAG: hypothetical protein UX87_C0014G0008 [Candidatus Amesbacteria bacterium GW2011_GWA1_47_16]OGC99631.1 MAG: hypothetical protein A2701_00275 [Candidatus Amesbacteria bacterium RIFCSPHIGHO2_01_FULL_47_34]